MSNDIKNGAVWFSSYPKSGNTWLRCLLEAYRRNGILDINDMRIVSSDGGATLIRGVSPMPLDTLGFNGQMLLRPAALVNLLCCLNDPMWIKTHFANLQPEGLPHCIPKEFTEKAIHVVRDPRSVLLSMSRFFGLSTELAIEAMNNKLFTIGDNVEYSTQLVSSWSTHVASWTSETRFPVHVVKYEDLMVDAGKELTEVLEVLGEDIYPERVAAAVEATELSQLKQKESAEGFRENRGVNSAKTFFNKGGTRWKDELEPKFIAQIEKDHGELMNLLGYTLSGD